MKALTQFTEKRFKRLRALLKAFPAGNEKEELHLIRLEVKKIKALLRLIHFHDSKFRDRQNYIPFRTIFRESGKIRDIGLRNELLNQYTQLHAPFFRSPDKAQYLFQKNVPAHIKTVKKQKKMIMKHIGEVKSHTYTRYLRKKNRELTNFLAERFTQKDLHGLRKLIKEISYLTLAVKKKSDMEKFLIESAELIGNWHDKRTIIPWIRTHAGKEKAIIKKLQDDSKADLVNLRKMILEKRKEEVESKKLIVKSKKLKAKRYEAKVVS